MRDYAWLLEYALNRCGSRAALEARLPQPVDAATLAAVGDDRYLSLLTRRIFRAGLKHSLVDAKWPAFECDRQKMQGAFNLWQEQSGRPLCQLSVMLALTVNH